MASIFLVRHGQYRRADSDPGAKKPETFDALVSATDGPLTELGREQAQRVAARFTGVKAAFYCSTLQRAIETAEIARTAHPDVELIQDPALCECLPSMPPRANAMTQAMSAEAFEASRQRADLAYDTLIANHSGSLRDALVFTHGNLIRYFVCRVLGCPIESWPIMDVMHGGITEIMFEDGATRLQCLNEGGHIPRDRQSYQ